VSGGARIRAAIDRGELVAILGDRPPSSKAGKTGPARVVMSQFSRGPPPPFPAARGCSHTPLRCPVYFVAGVYTRPITTRCNLSSWRRGSAGPPRARGGLARYAQAYASMLETYARSAPLNWFNFFDFWSQAESRGRPAMTAQARPAASRRRWRAGAADLGDHRRRSGATARPVEPLASGITGSPLRGQGYPDGLGRTPPST